MNHKIYTLALSALSLAAAAQTSVTFDTQDYKSVGVYDTWEESPFRTGTLEGNAQVIDNCFNNTGAGISNKTTKILGVQRSRFGSNTFGVRVDLNSPLSTSETTKYVHVLVYKPNTSKVMLVGLGKRESFTEEPTDIEQFWVESNYSTTANRWCDMVFPIKTVTGVKVYSFVIVPDLASPHTLTSDFACYIDQIEINSSSSQRRGPFTSGGGTVTPDPEPTDEVYSVNFDKTQTNTRESGSASGIRYLKGVSLKGSDAEYSYAPETTDALYHLVYKDATASIVWNVKAGNSYTPAVNYQGNWMHAYAYIDYNNDGKFTPVITNNVNSSSSEAVSYSAYNASDENTLYTTTGSSLTGDSRQTLSMPAFTIPSSTKPGIYRMRFKVDWNCIDAGGGDGSNSVNMQNIVNNGGGIIDVLLNVHGDNVVVNAQNRNGSLTTSDNASLINYSTAFGKSFGIKIEPAPGFENDNIVVRHGYNLSGEQYVNNNRQWSEVKYLSSQFGNDGSFTIPADIVDGDISIVGNFAQKKYVSFDESEAMPDVNGKINVTLTRKFSTQYYNTVCLPFSLNEAQIQAAFGSDARVYAYDNSRNDGVIYFDSSDKVVANVPFLLTTSTENGVFNFDNVTIESGEPVATGTDYDYVGNYDGKITLPYGTYFFNSNTFYRSIGKSTMKGYRAYFKEHESAGSRPIKLVIDGMPTAIENILAPESGDADIYSTDGVKMQDFKNLQKGVYINGHNKVLKK